MPAVIQRIVTDTTGLPVVETAVRSEALLEECEWTWSRELDAAHVFPDHAAAEEKARELDPKAFAVVRPVRSPRPLPEEPVKGVRVQGTITERIHAARHNRRVAEHRKAQRDREMEAYEATRSRLGEHDDE